MKGLETSARVWVTSEKDALKLQPNWARDVDVRVVVSEVDVDQADGFLDWVEQELGRGRRAP